MRTSVSLPDELASYVREVSSSADENQAEAIREALRHGRDEAERADDLAERVAELEAERDDLETECERLTNEKRQIIADRQEKQELVRYVKTERELERERAQANVIERAKWWLLGRDDEG